MPFIGVPVVQEVADDLYRVTGVSLGPGGSGTISLASGTGQVKLPRSDDWAQYRDVSLQDAVSVLATQAGPTIPPFASVPVIVTKAGSVKEDFLITMANGTDPMSQATSGPLEIYVRFH
jgi:hypothetical protein